MNIALLERARTRIAAPDYAVNLNSWHNCVYGHIMNAANAEDMKRFGADLSPNPRLNVRLVLGITDDEAYLLTAGADTGGLAMHRQIALDRIDYLLGRYREGQHVAIRVPEYPAISHFYFEPQGLSSFPYVPREERERELVGAL